MLPVEAGKAPHGRADLLAGRVVAEGEQHLPPCRAALRNLTVEPPQQRELWVARLLR